MHLKDVLKTSWRCLQHIFARRLEDAVKTSWRCTVDVFKTFMQYVEDVLKTSWHDVLKTSLRCITKTNILVLINTSWRSLEDVFWRRMTIQDFTWSRPLEGVLKTSSGDQDERHLQDVFKTSSPRRWFAGITHKI